MNRFIFYTTYAWRNIRRGGRWTTLAIFCIAAGVATVVALRSLGLAIGDSLVNNVRVDNKGDILLRRGNDNGFALGNIGIDENEPRLSPELILAYDEYVGDDAQWTAFFTAGNLQISAVDDETQGFGRPQFINTFMIDPLTYPPTHTIFALDPSGVPIAELFTDENDIVISQNMADAQELSVGDQVRVTGTDEAFTVRGIVAVDNEASLRNPFAGFFGFAYFDIDDARRTIDENAAPNTITFAFNELKSEAEIDAIVEDMVDIGRDFTNRTIRSDTAYSLLERNEQISLVIQDFIVVMGLGALLIGGVGILNTMLVMVRRRTAEIAAMKTFGLKGRQIAFLFFSEGLILGFFGSLIGSIAGVLMGGLVNQYGATFLNQTLAFKIYPEAIVYGVVLGLVITAIFGVAPIMTALNVRPGSILRPNETIIPRLSVFQTLLLMVIVTLSMGTIVGQIITPTFGLFDNISSIAPYATGIVGVALTFVFLGILVGVLWVLMWIIGRFPSFGSVDLRLALRNLSTQRLRTATTLLALSSGMFALSSITFVGQGAREFLNLQLAQQIGGNVLVFPLSPSIATQVGEFAVQNAVRDLDGINYSSSISFHNTELVAVDGERILINDVSFRDRVREGEFGPPDAAELAPSIWGNVNIWASDNPNILANLTIAQGRSLTLEDAGTNRIIGPLEYAIPLGIEVGSIVTYSLGNERIDYEVVGLIDGEGFGFTGGAPIAAMGSLGERNPDFRLYVFDVQPDKVNETLVALSTIQIPPTFAIDVSFIDSLLSRFIDQFAAIPTVVGLLSLLASAIIMANTVALATLERRRQIGILKSVGLKSWRVLIIMLIETSIVGLLSAILGIGLSALIVTVFADLSNTFVPLPTDAQVTTILLVIAAIVISVSATFISANVAVRERVMNVLRYE